LLSERKRPSFLIILEKPLRLRFKDFDYFHPQGGDLFNVECQVERQDVTEFKRLRSKVLKSLKPQYQRIVAASLKMAEFVKKEKTADGILSSSYRNSRCCFVTETFTKADEVSSALALRELRKRVQEFRYKPQNSESAGRTSTHF